ncbi:MAG: phage baseplate protein [Cetobacterium sp.]
MATVLTKFLNLFIDDRSNFAMLIRDFLENYKKIDEFAEKVDLRIYELETNKCPYNIGDLYITTNEKDPTLIWRATQWEKISNRDTFLAINPDLSPAGNTGGRNTLTLDVNNMPVHKHGVTVNQAGNHSHEIKINDDGEHYHVGSIANGGNHGHGISDHSHVIPPHKHTIPWGEHWSGHFPWGVNGTNNKTGQGAKVDNDNFWMYSEPIELHTNGSRGNISEGGNHTHGMTVNVSGIHKHGANSNQAGNHGHDISISNTGNGNPVSFLPSYFTVNLYKRIS